MLPTHVLRAPTGPGSLRSQDENFFSSRLVGLPCGWRPAGARAQVPGTGPARAPGLGFKPEIQRGEGTKYGPAMKVGQTMEVVLHGSTRGWSGLETGRSPTATRRSMVHNREPAATGGARRREPRGGGGGPFKALGGLARSDHVERTALHLPPGGLRACPSSSRSYSGARLNGHRA